MERHTVFTDWKTQDNKGVNSLKKKKIGFNAILIKMPTNFYRHKQGYSKIYMRKHRI